MKSERENFFSYLPSSVYSLEYMTISILITPIVKKSLDSILWHDAAHNMCAFLTLK